MTNKYFRDISVFFLPALLICLLFSFCTLANAHNDTNSHKVFKGMGDASRALMSKEGYGRSVFTLYVSLDATITNESGKNATENLVEKLGTAFIVRDDGFLLTNRHVADVSKIKKEFSEKLQALYSALSPPQKVDLHFTESYKAVDSSGITFLVSVVKISDSIDAAIFQFQQTPALRRKSFALEDESEGLFSPVAVLGSPLGISNVIGFGHIARTKLYGCGDEKQEYLLFISPLNPGNSGGPLYNLETDKVSGMVTAYIVSNKGNSLISCAVPASLLIKFLNENLPPEKK